MLELEEELKKLPPSPGVYLMKDQNDHIIYVGKAINLRNRVRSYFRESTVKSQKIQKMVSLIQRFEYIVTDSELEALVLENNLIKENAPKYNTMLKDDKTYPYIKVTTGEIFPRIFLTREMKKDHSRYFGPYTSAGAVRETIDLVNRLFQLRTCNRNLPRDTGKERACLNYHIHQCSAPCQGYVTQDEYGIEVEKALDFLNGNHLEVLSMLEEKMTMASEKMDFEEAIRCRDLIQSVKAVSEKQKITDHEGEDKDIVALWGEKTEGVVQVFFIRNGKMIGREHFYMTQIQEWDEKQILLSFVKQFYAGTPFLPREIMLPVELPEQDLLENWLTQKRGGRVYLKVPKKGSKEKLMELASKNAQIIYEKDKERLIREEARTSGAVKEIGMLLDLENISRMEAFDISNISGFANVGSMVVFENGKSKKSDYRKFRIKSVEGPDDYSCMKEVLSRRFLHGLQELEEGRDTSEKDKKESFSKFPDLILMDGGKGQVSVAMRVLEELNLNIPICGMVKDDHHRTRGLFYRGEEIPISKHSEGFKLITRIQDEAHRFAIEYHRLLRGKGQVKSILDDIPGVGKVRRKALMKHFSSLEELKKAPIEEFLKIPEMNRLSSEKVYEFFHSEKNNSI